MNAIFDLLTTFLNFNEDKATFESLLITVSKCWSNITQYLLNELLTGVKRKYVSEVFFKCVKKVPTSKDVETPTFLVETETSI